jgi:hypothetical protein
MYVSWTLLFGKKNNEIKKIMIMLHSFQLKYVGLQNDLVDIITTHKIITHVWHNAAGKCEILDKE